MPQVEAQTDNPPKRFAVVRIYETAVGLVDHIESDDLSETDVGLLWSEMRSSGWGPSCCCRLLQEHNWPSLVMVRGRPPLVPPPCDRQFEPTQLDASEATIHGIADELLNKADAGLHRTLKRRPRLTAITKLRLATTVIFLYIILKGVFLATVIPHAPGYGFMQSFLWAFIAIPLVYVIGYFALNRNWFLVPGGVVIRRFKWNGGAKLRVLSPQNAILSVNRRLVHIIERDSGKAYRANCDPLEVAALLAVWQSPIPAPAVSKLVDLQ